MPHCFWTHFWCGLFVGGGAGAWISWGLFASRLAFAASTAGIAVAFALLCGWWGDPAWNLLLEILYWISWW